MKFKSRKDSFFKSLSIVIILLLLILTFVEIYFVGLNNAISVFTTILMISVVGLLLWLYYNTEYELSQTELKYKSGPLHGKIKIEDIKGIVKGKTLWSGLKPATARNGLIIKYQKYEEIYISPETNDSFIDKILELNEKIKITE